MPLCIAPSDGTLAIDFYSDCIKIAILLDDYVISELNGVTLKVYKQDNARSLERQYLTAISITYQRW